MRTIISIDVETDGPIPGPNAMRQLGAAAFDMTGKELGSFCVNLKPLPGSRPDKRTMEWWMKQDAETRRMIGKNPVDPKDAITRFHNWVIQFQKPKLFAAPVAYDGSFVRWYTRYFGITSNIYHAMIDMRTVVWILAGEFEGDYKKTIQRVVHLEVASNPRPHYALEDAREQCRWLFALLNSRILTDARDNLIPF